LTAFMKTAPAETRTSDQLIAVATAEIGKGPSANLDEVLYLLKLAALKGPPPVMNSIGQILYGRNDPAMVNEMYGWFMEASIRGVPEAMSNLGFMYQNGLAVQTDYAIAITLYE